MCHSANSISPPFLVRFERREFTRCSLNEPANFSLCLANGLDTWSPCSLVLQSIRPKISYLYTTLLSAPTILKYVGK